MFLRPLLWLAILFNVQYQLTDAANMCPIENLPVYGCWDPAEFMLDVSADMGTADNINMLFDYFESKILGRFGFVDGQNAAIMSYGSGDTPYMQSNDYNLTCSHAETLRHDGLTNGLQPRSLVSALEKLYAAYGEGYDDPIILFSATNNQSDIDAAEDYRRAHLSSAEFTVIALNSSFKIWRNFHTMATYQVPIAQINDFKYLDICILQHSCGNIEDYCDIQFIGTTTTPAPSTASPSPSYAPPEDQCPCNASSVWNDVILAFDASENVGQEQLQKNWQYAKKAFSAHTIEKAANGQSMSIGIVLYGDDATVISHLGEMNGAEMQAIDRLPYLGGKGARADLAIAAASAELSGKNHRSASRPVIALFGNSYTGDATALKIQKQLFEDRNGDFVVYDHSSSVASSLHSLPTSTSKLIRKRDDGTAMQAAMCNANCHCAAGYTSFKNDANGNPIGGCYKMLPVVMNFALTQNTCYGQGGYVMLDESQEKTNFILNLISPVTTGDVWLGLTFNQNTSTYEWPKNRPLGAYQPWADGKAPTNTGCVLLQKDGTWTNTANCRNGYYSACEIPPCSSINKC